MLGIALALALSANPGSDVANAKAAFDAAQKLYRQGRYAEALSKFEEAYRAKPHPVIVYNIGRCFERLGDLPKAMRSYRDYLKQAPDAKDKGQVEEAIANLERRFKEQGVQQLLVSSDPEGALVSVDDKELGKAPVSTELPPGDHHVTLKLEGYEPARRVFVMPPNRSMDLSFSLSPKPPPAPELPPPPPPLVVVAPPPNPSATTVTARAAATEPNRGWLAPAGVAGAAALAGTIFLVASKVESDHLTGGDGLGPNLSPLPYDAAVHARGNEDAYQWVGVACMAGAAVSAGIAGFLFMNRTTAVTVAPTSGGAAMSVSGVFP